MAVVQDDWRERKMIEIFDLIPGGNNRIGVDAYLDNLTNEIELKTTSKGGVSTARDLGLDHINKWRKRYWIIASFKAGQLSFDRFFFFAPQHMELWYTGIEKRLGETHHLSARVIADLGEHYSPREREKIAYTLHRGSLLNDPNIPASYVISNGIEIHTDHAKRFRELVALHPITVQQRIPDPTEEFFVFG